MAGKVYSRVLYNRIQPVINAELLDVQCGFRPGRGCADQLHVVRRLGELAEKHGRSFYFCPVDFKKAFDWVNRLALWHILPNYGVQPTEINALEDLHTGNKGSIKINGHSTEEFDMDIGVRQGCILAALLFATFIDFVLRKAFADRSFPKGVKILYQEKGKQQLESWKDCTLEELIKALAYADDIWLMAEDPAEIRSMLLILDEVSREWGLVISVPKTKILVVGPAAATAKQDVDITINGEKVEVVDKFKYLGSMIS